ncbi:MAG: hypothetical protein FJ117_17695 [Deltaproteobacteria bacterium]|nr:hypothetical protein [Deltaproteobacteria bacterium]
MQIKSFQGKDVQDALRQVKEVLGPEAIILSTKTVHKPSDQFKRAKEHFIEVVAAIDLKAHPPPEFPAKAPLAPHPWPHLEKDRGRTAKDPMIRRFLSAGLYPEFVQGMLQEIRAYQKESGGWSNPETFCGFLRWKLMEAVDVTGPELNGSKIWAFVGPTGVGKTTTLAKLAAHFSLRFNKKITLITIDTYRIGAIEQLKTYARILRLPLEIAPDQEALKQMIENNSQQDLLLIDTAGRNPYHTDKLEELRNFLSVDPRVEVHLVLSATTKDIDLARNAEQFSLLPIRSYIFTKIDETEEYSSLFNQLLRYKRPLSYLTNGQKVPEDIELATKGRVANLILKTIQ